MQGREASESSVEGIPSVVKGEEAGCGIYYFFVTDKQIWLMTLYDKDEATDLTPKEKRILKDAIETELRARQATRHLRGTKSGRTRK